MNKRVIGLVTALVMMPMVKGNPMMQSGAGIALGSGSAVKKRAAPDLVVKPFAAKTAPGTLPFNPRPMVEKHGLDTIRKNMFPGGFAFITESKPVKDGAFTKEEITFTAYAQEHRIYPLSKPISNSLYIPLYEYVMSHDKASIRSFVSFVEKDPMGKNVSQHRSKISDYIQNVMIKPITEHKSGHSGTLYHHAEPLATLMVNALKDNIIKAQYTKFSNSVTKFNNGDAQNLDFMEFPVRSASTMMLSLCNSLQSNFKHSLPENNGMFYYVDYKNGPHSLSIPYLVANPTEQ